MIKNINIKDCIISFFSGSLLVIILLWFYSLEIHPDVPFRVFVYGTLLEQILLFFVALLLYRFGITPLCIGLIGLGFGFTDQLSHFQYDWGSATVVTMWMYTVAGLSYGYFFNIADKQQKKRYFFYAFLGALLVHGGFNGFLYFLIYLNY